jgi:RNA polymerase sigma-70 factor (ECF subfamily)
MSNTQQLSKGDWDWTAARVRSLRLARRLLANDADAEEAVQEALVRAWRRRDQCRGQLLPWLLEITRNEALRLGSRRRDLRPLDEAFEPAEQAPDEAVLERVELRRALARLPAADRALLALRYDADLTQSAVAKRAGLPEGTVKVRLHRLRNQLRDSMLEAP